MEYLNESTSKGNQPKFIEYDEKRMECCKSKIYTTDAKSFVPVRKILNYYADKKELSKKTGKALLDYVVDCVYKDTNLDLYIPCKQEGYERAKKVLLKRLKETEVCYG